MFRGEVSAYIFTSWAVFWRARRASQNTNNEYSNQLYNNQLYNIVGYFARFVYNN